MTKKRKALLALAAIIAGLWANNTSLFSTGEVEGRNFRLLAHRGVHQHYIGPKPGGDTCTARPIAAPVHQFLENTIPSMRAAHAAGAEVVELDIHLTTDGQFAVFHDWGLDCRTDLSGTTRDQDMATLKRAHLAYGYSTKAHPEGPEDYPFRNTRPAPMPTLPEVLDALPDGRFLINFKSNDPAEGEALVKLLADKPDWRKSVYGVYGGDLPTRTSMAGLAGLRGYDKPAIKQCLYRYLAVGWSGYMPAACRDRIMVLPVNVAPAIWGWPHKFTARMRAAGTDVILLGPWDGGGFSTGIDDAETLARIPDGFDGLVWTNRILHIAKAIDKPAN